MKKWVFFTNFLMTLVVFQVQAQNPVFDNLEMLYDQGHYRKVYKKSNRLLDNPEYDYSMMPKYYRSISMLQLAQNDFWRKRKKGVIQEAERIFDEVKKSSSGQKILTAHLFELAKLRQDLVKWKFALKEEGNESVAKEVDHVIQTLFNEMQQNFDAFQDQLAQEDGIKNPDSDGNNSDEIEASNVSVNRQQVLKEAKKHIGTPYKWAGNKPSSGFDCSGFTSYVLAKNGQIVPRRSSEQYTKSKKLKRKSVQAGDLVFFSNGSGVSHVGIVISKKGAPLQMIHSSSSRGIVITDVESSEYWEKRIHGYGTYLE